MTNSVNDGGRIYNMATLNIQNGSSIDTAGAGNQASNQGGGIYNYYGGHTTVTDSRILSNEATNGGGVFITNDYQYVVSVTGSYIVNNSDTSFFND